MRREQYIPERSIFVSHRPRRIAADSIPCLIGQHIRFEPDVLQSYFTRSWEPIIYDSLVLAAVVEFCDRTKTRPSMDWARRFKVSLPVHEPDRWNDLTLQATLNRALECLTGDRWEFTFRPIHRVINARLQEWLQFDADVEVVIPFSDGLDSLAISAILDDEIGDRVIKVRVGARQQRRRRNGDAPFAAIPFKVTPQIRGNQESSCRSRGFKFAMLSGIAAYLVRAQIVSVPESGQGALGPVLVNVGHGHPDRRTHPQFTHLMSAFLQELLNYRIDFEHRALWGTKAETLIQYRELRPKDGMWRSTRSCWQDARHASVDGQHRQCGICAACLIRRLSLHAAGFKEPPGSYVWDDLDAAEFWNGADPGYAQHHSAQREYALAGVLHLDHFASLPTAPQYRSVIERQGLTLSYALGINPEVASDKVNRLVYRHAQEWSAFLDDLSENSFIRRWAEAV